MSSQTDFAADPHRLPESAPAAPATPPPVWPAVVLLGLFWAIYLVWRWTDLGTSFGFFGFLIVLGILGLTTLLFAIWWLAASRVRWTERLLVFGAAVGFGIAAVVLSDKSLGPFMLLPGLPLVLTAATLALVLMRKWPAHRRRIALVTVFCLGWGAFLLLRGEGMGGDGAIAVRWRWSPTPEQTYLAELEPAGQSARQAVRGETLTLRPGDWSRLR